MSAKAKPVCKMRYLDLVAAIWKNDRDQGAFYPPPPSHACKQDTERTPIDRFDGGDLLPPARLDQARTCIANAEPAERRAA